MRLLPKADAAVVTLVTSSPLRTFDLSPLPFLDAHVNGLRLCAQTVEAVPAEESPILRFVRTPEGGGVGVIRANGGEAWRVVRKGSRLIRSGKWSAADHIVVLDGGNLPNITIFSLPSLNSTPRAQSCNVLGRG
jgi:hypothetical protein